MPSDVSTLESHLGYWLRLVSNQVSLSFGKRVQEEGVTVAEWVILRYLFDHNDAQATDCAKSLGLTKGAISKLIARLEEKNLVIRKRSKVDARSEVLNLTKQGQNLVPRLASIADKNDYEFFKCLSKSEAQTLFYLMKKIAEFNQIKSAPTN